MRIVPARRRGPRRPSQRCWHRHQPVDARCSDRGCHGRRAPSSPNSARRSSGLEWSSSTARPPLRCAPTTDAGKIAAVLASPPRSRRARGSMTPRRSPCASSRRQGLGAISGAPFRRRRRRQQPEARCRGRRREAHEDADLQRRAAVAQLRRLDPAQPRHAPPAGATRRPTSISSRSSSPRSDVASVAST